jgi:hypothetical protein
MTPSRLTAATLIALSGSCRPQQRVNNPLPSINPFCPSATDAVDTVTFHGDRARSGWNASETALTPASVASPSYGWLWDSEPFDTATVAGITYSPRIYGSPLYVDRVPISDGAHAGITASVVVVATSNAWVYAVNACDPGTGSADASSGPRVPSGAILWRTQLGDPAVVPGLDGGVPAGVLSTPYIDLDDPSPRIYVASASLQSGWQVFALDLGNGRVLPGWPVAINDVALRPINRNGPATFQEATIMSQRGALNLSPDRATLYVSFGSYNDHGAGWLVAVDTRQARLASAFSSAPSDAPTANGGIWEPGGPAVDAAGNVFATTGNSPDRSANSPHVWGESLLEWTPILTLRGTYTPFNHCQLDAADADLGGCSPLLVPDIDPAQTLTPRLVAFGGKQGNVYLLGRDQLPGRLDARPPCSTDSTTDQSLMPPGSQPQFGARGPLNVFGPYTEQYANSDYAKMRTTPALFQDAAGVRYLFVSGASKAAASSKQSVAPALVRLRIVTSPGTQAYLEVDAADQATVLVNPGSPVITSDATDRAVVWVLDENAQRTASLLDSSGPWPVLHAIDAITMKELWQSPRDLLHLGGKYTTPTIAHGFVFVGTDRIQTFGMRL